MSEATHVPVTHVQLHDLGDGSSTRAIGSITLGNSFVIHGVRVVEGEKGLFVAMPQRKDGEKYRDVAHPVTAEMRGLLANAVLEEYQRLKGRGERELGPRR